MFTDIDTETTRRLSEAKWYIDNIVESFHSPEDTFREKLFKGSFFVCLYGAIEYTVVTLISRVIDKINEAQHIQVIQLKSSLLSLLLHNECNALFQASDKKWKKRLHLFNRINDEEKSTIENTILPAQSGNLKYQQIEQICEVLGVEFPIINDPSLNYRLSTIADNRNAIAHGRKTVCEVGGQYTKNHLVEYYNAIQEYCLYLNQQLYQYIENRHYLKPDNR